MNTYTTVPSGEQVVQELPWRWKVQGRIFVIGGLGFMFDAWDVTLNGILIPLLSTHWALTPGEVAWVGTAQSTLSCTSSTLLRLDATHLPRSTWHERFGRTKANGKHADATNDNSPT